jgi:hypothetical protein
MRSRAIAGATLVAGGAFLLTSCAGTGVTSSRLEDAIGPTFASLYVRHQQLIGKPVPAAATQASATCHRTDSSANDKGAGDDWVCQLLLQINSPVQQVSYEVSAKANGCYTADGPPAVVGGRTITDAQGKEVVNPLSAFDGCYDTTS